MFFHFLKMPGAQIQLPKEGWLLYLQLLLQQVEQFVVEHDLIDFLNLLPFLPVQRFREVGFPYGPLNYFFDFQVFLQLPLHRTGDIGQVGFAGIVEQAGQLDPVGVPSVKSFPGTVDGVLAYGKKPPDMASSPALKGEGVGNILNGDMFGFDLQRIEIDAAVGFDVFFGFFHGWIFLLLIYLYLTKKMVSGIFDSTLTVLSLLFHIYCSINERKTGKNITRSFMK
jgi:hypothetical protein